MKQNEGIKCEQIDAKYSHRLIHKFLAGGPPVEDAWNQKFNVHTLLFGSFLNYPFQNKTRSRQEEC